MADFFKGLAGGFGTGLQFGQAIRERNMRDELAQAYAKPETSQGYTAETGQQLEALANTGAYDIVPQYGPAGEGQAQGAFTGYRAVPKAGLDLQGDMPAAPMAFNPQQVQDYGGRRVAGQFDPAQLRGLQMREAAGVLGRYGDVRGAATLEAQAEDFTARAEDRAYQAQRRPLELQDLQGRISGQVQQRQLTDLQLTDAQRKQQQQVAFDTGFADINKQTFEKPEERTAAILSLVERTQGVQAAEQLRASYSQNELNQISLQSKKFDEGFRQSRAKGVIPALEWFDEQNTSFKLERDPKNPFRVIQVNTDGTRSVFADAKNERELGMIVDAKAKPGGFLELAKFDLDQQKAQAVIAKEKALAGLYNQGGAGAGKGTLKQKVADFKEVYGRDPTEDEKGVLAGLVTKGPNKPDADRDAWLKAEQKLIEADASPEAIDAQRTAFFVRRGYAPAAARQVLEAGVNPATGKPLTRSDVDAYNRTYPQTPVDPGSLPWLPSPEREARRQGLISQIPR
jgi:predicted secreted protein